MQQDLSEGSIKVYRQSFEANASKQYFRQCVPALCCLSDDSFTSKPTELLRALPATFPDTSPFTVQLKAIAMMITILHEHLGEQVEHHQEFFWNREIITDELVKSKWEVVSQ